MDLARLSSGARTRTRWRRPTRPSAISSGRSGSLGKTVARQVPLARTRNIGIIAHIDAGKTTVTERILFYTKKIYKLGDTGADFWRGVESIRARLGANAVPIQIPIGSEDRFAGIVDLVEMKAIYYRDDLGNNVDVVEIPDELKADAQKHRHAMIEAVAEMDDELLHKYLEGQELTVAEIKRGHRLGTLTPRIIPLL